MTIRTDVPTRLFANIDSGQFQQGLLNLVRNAIDASHPGDVVKVSGLCEDAAIRVEIENAGRPISVEVVERIFEPFFTTKPGGTGLGLAIARNIARGHGGDLVLSRNLRDLVEFAMTLPIDTSAAEKL